jgi:hypothetical protein
MAERMTEAAKLYWQDVDVLEEARSELVDFLDTVWSRTLDEVLSQMAQAVNESDSAKIEHYAERQRPGRWYINLKRSQPVNFDIVISDPRRSDNWKFYNIRLRSYQSHLKKIEEWGEDAKTALNSLALSHGLSLKWSEKKNILCGSDVELLPENADGTSNSLIEEILRYLTMINEMYDWMLSRTET